MTKTKWCITILLSPLWLFVVFIGSIAEYLEHRNWTYKRALDESWRNMTYDRYK